MEDCFNCWACQYHTAARGRPADASQKREIGSVFAATLIFLLAFKRSPNTITDPPFPAMVTLIKPQTARPTPSKSYILSVFEQMTRIDERVTLLFNGERELKTKLVVENRTDVTKLISFSDLLSIKFRTTCEWHLRLATASFVNYQQ